MVDAVVDAGFEVIKGFVTNIVKTFLHKLPKSFNQIQVAVGGQGKYCVCEKTLSRLQCLSVAPKCKNFAKLNVGFISARPTIYRTRLFFISSAITANFVRTAECISVSRTLAAAATRVASGTNLGIGIKLGTTGNLSPSGQIAITSVGERGAMPNLRQNRGFAANSHPKLTPCRFPDQAKTPMKFPG